MSFFLQLCILILGLGIGDLDSSLVRHNIYNIVLLVSLSVLFRISRCVILCIGSSLMSFPRFDIRASGMVFFLFLLSNVFCCIYSTTFDIFRSFSFSNLSRKFLSVIDVINFDINDSVLSSWKSHSFSNSINFSQWCFGVCVSVCSAQKTREL